MQNYRQSHTPNNLNLLKSKYRTKQSLLKAIYLLKRPFYNTNQYAMLIIIIKIK